MPGAPTRASAGFFAAGDLTTMSILKRLFGARDDRVALRPLYATIVERGRDPAWYAQGGVPDTLDGRFDMVATMLSLVLIRLEREGDPGRLPSTFSPKYLSRIWTVSSASWASVTLSWASTSAR